MAFSEIALRALKDVVGDEHVSDDPVICQSYSRVQWTADGCIQRSQLGTQMRPTCVVLPDSTEEVQAIVKLANRYQFVFIPRGSGMINSAFPNPAQALAGKGVIIVDPKRMDKIIKVDKNNMYMVIEPYVNFASCQAEAMKVGCTFPSPPAGAQVSALANIQWHGAYGNSWLSALGAHQLLSFEVVLPNGEILRSGSISQAGSDDWIWNDGPGPDLRGFFRGAQFGHAGGMGMVTKISTRLFPWPGPVVFPTQGNAVDKESFFPMDKVRWYMIDFPAAIKAYPDKEEEQLRWSCDLHYEIARAELAIVVQHNAKQFMWTWAARSKEEFHKGANEDFYPHGYNIVALSAITSVEQLEYEEKVLKHIVKKMGGIFLSEESPDPLDRERYKVWMRVTNDWIRTAHSMRLSRPTDCFHQGTACLDSIDTVAEEILRANRVQRKMREAGKGQNLLPISFHGGWISPLEKGYGALMTTDLWPEQEPEKAAEAIQFLLSSLVGMLGEKCAGATVCLLGPAYDLLGPQFFNVHLLVKAMKREFDPNNISNPPYATTPDIVDPIQLAEMTKVL
ncbi:MAG: FAD-binding oxidoreductase [Proteobacteria bacterium]|nr:FAD-binding oxidoreductase [Pseudomonadota bacterium]